MPPYLNRLLTFALLAFIVLAGESLCPAANRAPDTRELKKTEKALAKLSELQTASTDLNSYKAAIRKLYPQLFINIADLREGDLKTDLSTAAFLYQKAYALERGDTAADCNDEVRDLYRNLCLTQNKQTRSQLLLVKAQLHFSWAGALMRFYRGERDAQTVAAVSEIRKERRIDLTLAERVVAILKTLDSEVNSYSSLGEFEEHRAVAKVSYGKLSNDFETMAETAQPFLSSLPRNSLYYQLQNALNSYSDGLFWWQKTYRRKTDAVVSANNWTEPTPKQPLGFDSDSLNYTVICNWRRAHKHIASAAIEIESAKNNLPVSNSTSEYISLR
jgi:hypothetical protein